MIQYQINFIDNPFTHKFSEDGWACLNFMAYQPLGLLMQNPFLYKWTVLFQTIQFKISTQFVKNISISSYSVESTVLIQTIQVSFCLYSVKCQNSFILNNSS